MPDQNEQLRVHKQELLTAAIRVNKCLFLWNNLEGRKSELPQGKVEHII